MGRPSDGVSRVFKGAPGRPHYGGPVRAERTSPEGERLPTRAVEWAIIVLEYSIVVSLLGLAGVVLVRTVVGFFEHWTQFPETVVTAIDGILVVIILLDIGHTVYRRLGSSRFPIRPFLIIGVLAGIRDILSASARLTLSPYLKSANFHETIISLGIGVGVVVALLFGLFLLRFSGEDETP